MPPPAATELTVAQFADLLELLPDELLLPHPAASTTQPQRQRLSSLFAPFPSDLHDHVGSGTRASSRGKMNKRYPADFQFISYE
jgi:hypothetical protein